MKFIIKQRIIALGDRYVIQDEAENDRYMIKRIVISLLRKYFITDTSGKYLAEIRKKILSIFPQFYITLEDGTKAIVKKKFKLFGHNFNIQTDVGSFEIKGDFLGHEFEILKDNNNVAKVSKKWIAWSDTYGVEIQEEKNLLLILAIIMIIDISIHERD